MPSTRAKFQVTGVTIFGDAREVRFWAVGAHDDPNHENSKFWKATPGGEIKLYISNPAAYEQFAAGQYYYIDFVLADSPVSVEA